MSSVEPLLSVRGLSVAYGPLQALFDVSFDLYPGEVLGVAGESGSGKSTLAHAIARTLPPPAVIIGGEARLGGRDLMQLDFEEMQTLRQRKLAIVLQSAMNALNPVMQIGEQLVDGIVAHEPVSRAGARSRSEELLDAVGVGAQWSKSYPHQLSGGMRQRVAIAMALSLHPDLLLMDEPTTALDVVVQKSILDELARLQKELGFAIVFVTHDLPLLFDFADRVLILYGGRVAEFGSSSALQHSPRHPYSQALIAATPRLYGEKRALVSIRGNPPALSSLPSGCPFHPRCDRAESRCAAEIPATTEDDGRRFACHLPLP